MENQPLSPYEMPGENSSEPQEPSGLWQRIGSAWLHFSGPDIRHFSASLEDQERLRRSRVLSALFPLILIDALVIAPTAIPVPTYWIPIFSTLFFGLIVLLFNRAGYINLSGLCFVFAIDSTIVILMITLPSGIRNSNIPDFDFFLLSLLIGGIVLPRRFLPFIAFVNIILIFALFALLPHDPLLTEEIRVNQGGFAYSELSDAFVLQLVGLTIAWLSARSVDKALLRASRAEELVETQQRLNEQGHLLIEQSARVEYGLDVLKDAHARFANGDYTARANLQENELVSLALSFNLMAERLHRVALVAQDHERLGLAFQQFFALQDTLVHGTPLPPLVPTGTVVDNLYPWLKQYYQLRQGYLRSTALLERLRLGLTRQRTLLAQLTLVIDQIHAAMRTLAQETHDSHLSQLEFVEKAQRISEQVTEVGRQCLQETRQIDQLFKQ
jgi:HAMP domain-containing protein